MYGLDGTTYQQLLRCQNGACALCGKAVSPTLVSETRPPDIDHDHMTGAVRGLLCHSCNLRLGHLERALRNGASLVKRDLEFEARAMVYLARNEPSLRSPRP